MTKRLFAFKQQGNNKRLLLYNYFTPHYISQLTITKHLKKKKKKINLKYSLSKYYLLKNMFRVMLQINSQ